MEHELARGYRAALGIARPGASRTVVGGNGYLAAALPVLPFAVAAVGLVEDAADRLRAALSLTGVRGDDGGGGAGASAAGTPLDRERVAAAYQSDKLLRFDGEPVSAFAELSGFFRTADGWIRTHANYPHHHDRLCRVLGLPFDANRTALERAVRTRSASDIEDAAAVAGALAVRVRSVDEWRNDPQWSSIVAEPLVRVSKGGAASVRGSESWNPGSSSGSRPGTASGSAAGPGSALVVPVDPFEVHRFATARFPLAGLRVLDLTRVIAGPVATRTLALLGADVLRVDSPRLPEIAW